MTQSRFHLIYVLLFALIFSQSNLHSQDQNTAIPSGYIGLNTDFGSLGEIGSYFGYGFTIQLNRKRVQMGIGYNWGSVDNDNLSLLFPEQAGRYRDVYLSGEYYPMAGRLFQIIGSFDVGILGVGVKPDNADGEPAWNSLYKSYYASPGAGVRYFISEKISIVAKYRYGFVFNDDAEDLILPPDQFRGIRLSLLFSNNR